MSAKAILVVEDEALIALSIEATLSPTGCQVLIAFSLQEAQEVFETNRSAVAAAILDHELQGVSVEPLAGDLQAAGVPFIICSGLPREQLPELLATVPYVTKPFSDETLLTALRHILSAASSRPDATETARGPA